MEEIVSLVDQFSKLPNRPKVGLSLAGGAARGIAHIGVLKFFEEIKLPIDLIVGTSAGAIAGGVWACGVSSAKMYRLAKNTEWWFLARPVAFKSGLLSSQGIENWVRRIIRERTFTDLDIELAVTATDFLTGELVVIKEGDVARAVRISSTVPGVYEPVLHEGRPLVDGGLVQNLPAEVGRALGADFLIGVDLHSDVLENEVPKTVLWSMVHAINILQRQHEIIQAQLVDVLIQPKVGDHSAVNFKVVDDLTEEGYLAAKAILAQLKNKLKEIIGGTT
ncbi:MAG: patatin-like phospholipase family protein [Firmicutes bacterium]|nr:patatin-like phospholipase family protein [Bacillota bacterium]